MKRGYRDIEPYVTKDGSIIRELVHPGQGVDTPMSLAEATVPPGQSTLLHLHRSSGEIYHILRGEGRMRLGSGTFDVGPGDSVFIRPGTPHGIENTGKGDLVILCCCSPAYAHEDTVLLEGEEGRE